MWRYLVREIGRLGQTSTYSWQGFRAAWRSEKSVRQWAVAQVLSVGLAFVLDLTAGERALIVALGFIVLAAELFNTAIEAIVDLASPERHPLAGKAKDCGSAAVALTGLGAGLAWAVILIF